MKGGRNQAAPFAPPDGRGHRAAVDVHLVEIRVSTLPQLMTTYAKASLTSNRSMSFIFMSALSRIFDVAAIGPSRW